MIGGKQTGFTIVRSHPTLASNTCIFPSNGILSTLTLPSSSLPLPNSITVPLIVALYPLVGADADVFVHVVQVSSFLPTADPACMIRVVLANRYPKQWLVVAGFLFVNTTYPEFRHTGKSSRQWKECDSGSANVIWSGLSMLYPSSLQSVVLWGWCWGWKK